MTRTLPFIVAQLALLITGVYLLTTPMPLLLGSGLAVAAAAPFVFMVGRIRTSQEGMHQHPVLTSVICGFGCVMTMFGVYRFGDQHQWVLWLALVALCLWMAWQRYVWRRPTQSS